VREKCNVFITTLNNKKVVNEKLSPLSCVVVVAITIGNDFENKSQMKIANEKRYTTNQKAQVQVLCTIFFALFVNDFFLIIM
jgi:hypothetical protein